MTWLYSLIFTGLLIAADSSTINNDQTTNMANTSQAIIEQTIDIEERFEQTYPLTPDGSIKLQNINGSIEIEAWDKNEVHVLAIKIAETSEALKNIEIDIKAKSDSITIEANDRENKNRGLLGRSGRSAKVRFYLKVPRNATLDEIGVVNGAIKIENMANKVSASAVNGSIIASNLSGSTTLETVNGGISAGFNRLSPNAKVLLNTVNGHVSLTLPSVAEAIIRANTLNGKITNGLGLRINKGLVGSDLYGKIGNGTAQVKLNSVSGTLTINRAGGQNNKLPAEDLSPEKDGEEIDHDLMSDLENLPQMSELNAKELAKMNQTLKENQAKMKALNAKTAETLKKAFESSEIAQKAAAENMKMAELNVARRARSADLRAAALTSRIAGFNWANSSPSLYRKTGTFKITGKPKVVINVKNAYVSVRSWDRDEVRYVVSETSILGKTPEAEIKEDQSGNEINLTITGDSSRNRDLPSVRVDVTVPKASDVRVISDGPIRLDGVSGSVDLTGDDENIDVRDASGKLSIKNADGRVRVIGFSGDMNSATRDGEIFLEGDFNSLSSTAEDATVTVVLSENANAKLISTTPIFTGETQRESDQMELSYGSGGPTYNFKFDDGRLIVRQPFSNNR